MNRNSLPSRWSSRTKATGASTVTSRTTTVSFRPVILSPSQRPRPEKIAATTPA
jgi:hypothetical protein